MAGTDPGWYPDHSDAGLQRYWDGTQWTDHVHPVTAPAAGADPVSPGGSSRLRPALLILAGLAVVVAVAVGVVVLTGDDADETADDLSTQDHDDEGAGDESAEDGDDTAGGGEAVAGRWTGSYTCPQGDTGLELTIEDEGDDAVSATFAFSALASNPGVASGAFTMTGTFEDDRLELEPEEWIDQPEDYAMIGLESRALDIEDGEIVGIAGEVTVDSACSTFLVTRDA